MCLSNLSGVRPDEKIAILFNREGQLSATGKPFSQSIIRHVRITYSIPAPILKRSDELTVTEVADRFDVSSGVVYYWIERGYLKARRLKMGLPYWITLDAGDEENLRQKVLNSYKLHVKKTEHS